MHMTRFLKSLAVLTLAAGPLLGLSVAGAATAATAAPAVVSSHTSALASAGTAVTAAANSPQVDAAGLVGKQCSGSSTAHWFTVHIYWDGGTWQNWCYGYAGSFSWPDDNQISSACAGNNYGTFVYYDWATGKNVTVHFSPGWHTSLASDDEMVSLSITKWSGTYNC